ncbi:CocE/NonD family hydrolase [Actinoplanes sp. KI2]|uniref:CocE/NonD family hydrolase n=1 Tax=Actinoplanes sp. KI2 TaxID=2983315 RepID=UPI0021D5984B|nr:CocE/NonD family hydrolase [Actinoplanes sp. KI2]MCU7725161.1 CocE/NonD family hydrolase [Actinoplanes sp. KI2]
MALQDQLASRVLKLPGAVQPFSIDRGLRIPMRDGVTLAADHYVPAGEPAGTLLVRGPYGRRFPFNLLYARPYAARGYHVVFVSCRGTATSDGDFDPMRTERADGRDVVAWLLAQPWFTGTFATIGPSYLGYVQWALLEDPPDEMAAAVITVGPHDFARHSWGTGSLNLDLVGWSDMVSRLPRSDKSSLTARVSELFAGPARTRALRSVFTDLPLVEAAERHYAGRARWFRDRATRTDLADPYWEPMRHPLALERARIPILLHSGWQDLFLQQTIEQYERLHARGVDVALTVGPWTHTEVIGRGASILIPETLDWLGAKLRGEPLRRAHRVRVQVTGARDWRESDAWPPPTRELALHLRPGGGLGEAAAGEAAFTFDPAEPTPAIGGPLLEDGGYVDDSALAARPDVLAFTGEPLAAAFEVHGSPVVELAHRTDNPHADLFVRISEVDPAGRSRNVTEGYRRLDPDRDQNAPVRLPLLPIAHRFAAGSRVRVLIAGGCYPQFARNLGTAENPGLGTKLQPTRHTLALGPSRIVLPRSS